MFLDTSGLMCLFDRRDRRHSSSLRHFENAQVRLVHNYVYAEFIALAIARKAPRLSALDFVDALNDDPGVETIWVSEALHSRGMTLLRERADKAWSLCDSISFVLMSERHIIEALTTDHNFEQAGYIRLLDQ